MTRCVDGRLYRHDPQPDDPDFETDIGKCPGCEACATDRKAPAKEASAEARSELLVTDDDLVLNALRKAREDLICRNMDVSLIAPAIAIIQSRRSAAPGRGESGAPDDLLQMVRAELYALLDKVEHAGKAGYFDNWEPAYKRAMRVLKLTESAQMAQSNDHARGLTDLLQKARRVVELGEVAFRTLQERPAELAEYEAISALGINSPFARNLLLVASRLGLDAPSGAPVGSPAPLHAGRGESDAIQGPASDVVQNKEEKK